MQKLILIINFYYQTYSNTLWFIFLCFILECILFIVSYLVSPKNANTEKLSAYGFKLFNTARKTFNGIDPWIIGCWFVVLFFLFFFFFILSR